MILALQPGFCETRARLFPFTFNLQVELLTFSGPGGTLSLALREIEC